jgi:hypothetical protein
LGFGITWQARNPAHIPQRGEGQGGEGRGVASRWLWADDVALRLVAGVLDGLRVLAGHGVGCDVAVDGLGRGRMGAGGVSGQGPCRSRPHLARGHSREAG